MTGGEEAGTHPWFEGGTTLQHARRTESTHMTRADAHRYAQLPPGEYRAGGRVFARPAGLPYIRRAPQAEHRKTVLHLLTQSMDDEVDIAWRACSA